MPSDFWSLTVREFHIKFRAFMRSENRAESTFMRQALRTTAGKSTDPARVGMGKAANRLRQYPVKPWLKG
jgi:hypothetical protein